MKQTHCDTPMVVGDYKGDKHAIDTDMYSLIQSYYGIFYQYMLAIMKMLPVPNNAHRIPWAVNVLRM